MTTVLERLNSALHHAMEKDEKVYVLGEDILDPYGGAFKVTHGLSTKFPARVITTPISEAGIVGVATGMAMRGLHPVVEIMFGDFVTLAADQIINHAAKFRWMYNDQVSVPLVVRTPMGGRRGYGPTHSQSLEKIFLGIPGLLVVAPNTLIDPAELLLAAIEEESPILFIEHKLLYTCPLVEQGEGDLIDFTVEKYGTAFPTHVLRIPGHEPHLTFACYGYNFELVKKASNRLLMENEIFSEIVLFSQISPYDVNVLRKSVLRAGNLLTVEEGTLTAGWGAEILARMAEMESGKKTYRMNRVAAWDLPIANSRELEDVILPSVDDIYNAAIAIVEK